MAQYILGVDNGLTLSKAALFDLDGNEVQVASRKVEVTYPRPGWTERDMGAVWQSTVEAIRAAIEGAGVRPEEIVGVGNSAHGNGIYLLDKQGEPFRPAVASMDTRATDVVDDWSRRGVCDQAFPAIKQSIWAAQPATMLAWFKRHEPGTYANIGHALTCKDYIKYCLTGTYTADFTDSSGSSLLDSTKGCYTDELLEMYGIPEIRRALAQPIHSHEVAGRVTPEAAKATGLASGTPVVGGVFDVDSDALGAGVVGPGVLCMIAGTWSINEVVTPDPILDRRLFMCSMYAVPGMWLTSEASPTSAANLEWFVTNFCAEEKAEARARGVSVYEVCNEKVASLPPGGTDVIFHPFLFGSNAQPTGRAGFYGLGAWHTKAHVLRALYEGVLYGHMQHVDKLKAAGAKMDRARFTGGGSHSLVWTQMFSDALQLPIEVPAASEIASLGAAMVAGIGAGVYRGYDDAVARTVKVERVHQPDPEATPKYLARYQEYQVLVEAMREPWDRLAKLSA